MCIKVLQRVSDQNNVKGSSYINNNKKQCSEKRVQSVYRPWLIHGFMNGPWIGN